MRHPARLAAVLCLVLAPVALGQRLLWQRDGVVGQYTLWGATVIGDIDHDGWEDVAVGAGPYGSFDSRELWMLSGRDGSTLRVRPQYAPNWVYGTVARAGDVNGDGVPDYAFKVRDRAGPSTYVEVASGADDTRIWRVGPVLCLNYGDALLGDVDLDRDGRPDLVVVDSYDVPVPVEAFDASGRLLYSVPKPPGLEYLGFPRPETIAAVGDLDGDGADDYAIGAADAAFSLAGVVVISGATGQVLRNILTSRFPFRVLGQYVVRTDDFDGDGVRDLLVGADCCPGVLVLFSLRTGQELRWWPSPDPGTGFMTSMRAVDLDRDGVRDALLGSAMTGTRVFDRGRILAYSGRDGGLLLDIRGSRLLGLSVDVLRGPANDPFPLFVATMPEYGYDVPPGFALGRVLLYRAKPPTVTLPGAPPCQGGLPAPAEIGLRDLAPSGGRGVQVHLSEAPSGVNVALYVGLSNTDWNGVPLPLDLSFLSLPGCALHTSVDAQALRVTGTSGLDAGYASVALPFDLSMTGVRVYAQWIVFGPGNTWPGGLTRPLSWQLAL